MYAFLHLPVQHKKCAKRRFLGALASREKLGGLLGPPAVIGSQSLQSNKGKNLKARNNHFYQVHQQAFHLNHLQMTIKPPHYLYPLQPLYAITYIILGWCCSHSHKIGWSHNLKIFLPTVKLTYYCMLVRNATIYNKNRHHA